MKCMYEEKGNGEQGDTFVLILDKKEAQQLVDIAEAAAEANKRKASFKTWKDKLVHCLPCF